MIVYMKRLAIISWKLLNATHLKILLSFCSRLLSVSYFCWKTCKRQYRCHPSDWQDWILCWGLCSLHTNRTSRNSPFSVSNTASVTFSGFKWWTIFLLQEVDTYFSEGLTKWRDLNLTDNFSVYTHTTSRFHQPLTPSLSILFCVIHLMPEKRRVGNQGKYYASLPQLHF